MRFLGRKWQKINWGSRSCPLFYLLPGNSLNEYFKDRQHQTVQQQQQQDGGEASGL
jgi:hypothetical protein